MNIIIDKRMPLMAKQKLAEYGNLIELPIHSNVFVPISAHPDVFIAQMPKELIIAPNTKSPFIKELDESGIIYSFGNKHIGNKHPETVGYNVVVTDSHIIHNPAYTDISIIERCKNHESIEVKQSYTRCSTIHIGNNRFITSDMSIYQSLFDAKIEVLLVTTESIVLEGLKYGLFGGCCGFYNNTLFICGSLKYYADSEKVRIFTQEREINIVELYDGALVDIGGLFFIDN